MENKNKSSSGVLPRARQDCVIEASIMEDVKIDVRIKLSVLWVAAMFYNLYADVLAFFAPGILEELIAGEVGGMQITQLFLVGSAIFMVPPRARSELGFHYQ